MTGAGDWKICEERRSYDMLLNVPVPDSLKTASEFVNEITGLARDVREEKFEQALTSGYVPTYMRAFVDVNVGFIDKDGKTRQLVIYVLPDYLSVGTDADNLRVPLTPLGAQKIADVWGCILPTAKMVTIIWGAASYKLPPQPWGPPYDATMMSTERIVAHDHRVDATAKSANVDPSKLVAGHKKDVVITNKLAAKPNQVAIFGWHKPDGSNIQPLYLGHENVYADYSHSIRLISKVCILDGVEDDLVRIMQDPELCVAVSDEGPMQIVRQPGV